MGTGGSNWFRTIIPELVDDGPVPLILVAGSVAGLGAVAPLEPSGWAAGAFAGVEGNGELVAV
jgi:hypothetical protein